MNPFTTTIFERMVQRYISERVVHSDDEARATLTRALPDLLKQLTPQPEAVDEILDIGVRPMEMGLLKSTLPTVQGATLYAVGKEVKRRFDKLGETLFLAVVNEQTYLIDTSGYPYIRYAGRLVVKG